MNSKNKREKRQKKEDLHLTTTASSSIEKETKKRNESFSTLEFRVFAQEKQVTMDLGMSDRFSFSLNKNLCRNYDTGLVNYSQEMKNLLKQIRQKLLS